MKERFKVEESVAVRAAGGKPGLIKESYSGDLPLALFCEIHSITANWITRNYTYYPMENLLGNVKDGSGISSFTSPYPIPVIRDHISSPSMFDNAFACEPYGRVYNASFVNESNGGGWVRSVAAITDPWAMSMILSGRFLTVSIGGEVDEVYCSVCSREGNRQNMVETGLCDHVKGQSYNEQLCYWTLGPLFAREISFVNQPSDVNARVVNPSLGSYEARTLLAGTDGEFLVDMTSGAQESVESYRSKSLGISKQVYNSILRKARLARTQYEHVAGHEFLKHLDNPDYLKLIKSNLKGL